MLMADITHGVLKSFSLYSSIFHAPSHQASTQLWLPRTWFQVRTPAMRAGMPTERSAQTSRTVSYTHLVPDEEAPAGLAPLPALSNAQ